MTKARRETESPPLLELVTNTPYINNVEPIKRSSASGEHVSETGKHRLTERRQLGRVTPGLYGQLLRQMLGLVRYTYDRIEKYPKGQKLYVGLGNTIINETNHCLKLIRSVCAYNPFISKEAVLRDVSVSLKTIEDYVEISCDKKFISIRNRDAWLRQLTQLDDVAIGLAMWLEKSTKTKQGIRNGATTKREIR